MGDITSHEIGEIKVEQNEHKKELASHDRRIVTLEINQARTDVQIQSMVSSIKELVGSLKFALFACIGMLAGFLIWYIQKL